ncbi:hypothetical protein CC86DRAFT_326781 [Ophiobolus disseminans]|uniref:Uncharacterized protein n=1 Tax=Ophiobolus disseminans TaxID=1469910 RepID=A0A6A6ZT41_9PLEO|nr:hypothetical protein CC86DRAFT_326781 [Ophiobolus disseminans]
MSADIRNRIINVDGVNVGPSLRRLFDVTREGLDRFNKLQDLAIEYDRLKKKIARVETGIRQLQSGPHSDACDAYAQAWSLSFASKLLCLPRELRNMVYGYIWTKDYLDLTKPLMVGALKGQPDEGIPHVVDVSYVGPEIALEIVEAYHGKQSLTLQAFRLEEINRIFCDDVFCVGITPATMLRGLQIFLDVDGCLSLSNPAEVDVQAVEPSLNHLLMITKKKDFQLSIELHQCRIRLKLWNTYVNILRPILHAFESEGARVDIFWTCRYSDSIISSKVRHKLKDMIRLGAPIDKDTLIQSLGKEYHIRANDSRQFLWEEDYDYDFEGFEPFVADSHGPFCYCTTCLRMYDNGRAFRPDRE